MQSYHLKAKFLYKFLKKHRCVRQYVENILEQKGRWCHTSEYLENHDIIKLIEECSSQECNINFSFLWARTKQGHSYWSKLDRIFEKEWTEYVRQTEEYRKESEIPI